MVSNEKSDKRLRIRKVENWDCFRFLENINYSNCLNKQSRIEF